MSSRMNEHFKDFIESSIPEISFFIDNDKEEILIFHKKDNSLLKFYMPREVSEEEVSSAITKALDRLDWSKNFDEIFTYQKYRLALMNVPNMLIGD